MNSTLVLSLSKCLRPHTRRYLFAQTRYSLICLFSCEHHLPVSCFSAILSFLCSEKNTHGLETLPFPSPSLPSSDCDQELDLNKNSNPCVHPRPPVPVSTLDPQPYVYPRPPTSMSTLIPKLCVYPRPPTPVPTLDLQPLCLP